MLKRGNYIFGYFLFSSMLGTIVYFLQKNDIALPRIVRFYLNDFLIIPIVLSVCLYVIRGLRRDYIYKIPVIYILYVCFGYSFFFEYYLPKILSRYTSDFIDVILYFAGGGVFYLLQKYTKVISE